MSDVPIALAGFQRMVEHRLYALGTKVNRLEGRLERIEARLERLEAEQQEDE